jgi:hypothetical protein
MDDGSYRPPISDAFLREIGLITAYWSALETQIEFLILHMHGIGKIGRVLTAKIDARAKIDLLRVINQGGGFGPDKTSVSRLIERIKQAHDRRNEVVHNVWFPTFDPLIAERTAIRAAGELKIVSQPVWLRDLKAISRSIRKVGLDLSDLIELHGFSENHPKNTE